MLANRSNWRLLATAGLIVLAMTVGQPLTPASSATQEADNQNNSPASGTTDSAPQGTTATGLTAAADATTAGSSSLLFFADFGQDADVNYDRWPDNWSRRKGSGYPHFVDAELTPNPEGDVALCVSLDGGRFAAIGPEIAINPRFSYHFSTRVLNQAHADAAFLAVTWLDAQHQPLGEVRSESALPGNSEQLLTVSPEVIPMETRYAQPVLETVPGRLPDLDGKIWFDDVQVSSAPRITLSLSNIGNRAHFFHANEAARVQIVVNGRFAEADDVTVQVTLTDEVGDLVIPLKTFPVAPNQSAGAQPSNRANTSAGGQDEFETEVDLPPLGVGYYRLTASLLERGTKITSRRVAWVVVSDEDHRMKLDFAWSAENGAAPLTESQLVETATASGIGWLKYPVWMDPQDESGIARMAHFADELWSHDIRLVGLLNHPPNVVLEQMPEDAPRNAAGIFSLPVDVWYPHFLPTQRRIAMSVRRWQLSTDDDMSFVGYRNLPQRMTEVKAALDRLGHDVEMGIAWNWLYPFPKTEDTAPYPTEPPWSELSLSTSPPLSPAELSRYLAAGSSSEPRKNQIKRWVNVLALPPKAAEVDVRATHLAKQIVAAKAFGASGVNLPRALSPKQGMIHEDGSPAELFLVWRTLASQLSGAEFLGSLRLPGGSQNLVFTRAGQALMVVWNDRSTSETIYLGSSPRQIDLWGRENAIDTVGDQQSFQVGQTPTIITDLSELIARFRIEVKLEREIVPAVFGRTFSNSIAWSNPFPYPIGGRVTFPTPPGWEVSSGTGEFHLPEGQSTSEAFYASFPHTAETGKQLLKLDFRVVADRDYRFSVYRDIEVGMAEIEWDVTTRIDPGGVLHIEHRLRNLSDRPYRVRAVLHSPNRQRRATPLLTVEPGINYHEVRIFDAHDLRGQTVRILLEEPGTNRFLNKRIKLHD
ncbi:MAG: hypothetical protein MPJ50_11280 [Pirellulales bacterium]|nr:hypothetical protein [Pirellulales bacterium]